MYLQKKIYFILYPSQYIKQELQEVLKSIYPYRKEYYLFAEVDGDVVTVADDWVILKSENTNSSIKILQRSSLQMHWISVKFFMYIVFLYFRFLVGSCKRFILLILLVGALVGGEVVGGVPSLSLEPCDEIS